MNKPAHFKKTSDDTNSQYYQLNPKECDILRPSYLVSSQKHFGNIPRNQKYQTLKIPVSQIGKK